MRSLTAALKREFFTGSLSCGPSAALCGKQHSNYIDFYLDGQVKTPKKLYFKGFLEILYIDFQNFFLQYIGVIPVIHISTLLLSLYPHFVEKLWITVFFALFLSTKWLKLPFIQCFLIIYASF